MLNFVFFIHTFSQTPEGSIASMMRVLRLTLSCVVATILAPVSSLARSPRPPSNMVQGSQTFQEDNSSAQQSHNLNVRQSQSSAPKTARYQSNSLQTVCNAAPPTTSSAPPSTYVAKRHVAIQARYAATMAVSRRTET